MTAATAVTWLLLALAIVCVPAPSATAARAASLAAAGRLATAQAPRRSRRLPQLEPSRVAVLTCVVATASAGRACGAAIGVAVGAALATMSGLAASGLVRRRDAARRRMLVVAVRLLVAELEAGSRPPDALTAAAEASPAQRASFVSAARAAEAGADVGEVLSVSPELAAVGRAWQVASVAGTPLAGVLGRVAADLDAREDQFRSVAAALAGARSSALLLAGLPVLGIALGAAMGARPVHVLLGTPGGRLVCCAGVFLDAAGVLWTHRLMLRAERS